MLNIKEIRENPEKFKNGLKKRMSDIDIIDRVIELDKKLKKLITERDRLNHLKKVETKRYFENMESGQDGNAAIC